MIPDSTAAAALTTCVLALTLNGIVLAKSRRRMQSLRQRILPYGWKTLPDGPAFGPLPDISTWLVEPLDSRVLFLYLDAHCGDCYNLQRALPAFLEDAPGVQVIVLSSTPLFVERLDYKRPKVRRLVSPELVRYLSFKTAPYAVYLEGGNVERKGIVNRLEQLRLIVDPSTVQMDLRLQ